MTHTDIECSLYGTKECALLNIADCNNCPLHRQGDVGVVGADLDQFAALLPEEGVHGLFETDTCTLCKGEARKANAYAVIDMAHKEPQRISKTNFRNFFHREKVGFILPLQFAVCGRCRRRMLFLDYLPLLTTVFMALVGTLLLLNETLTESMRAVNWGLPLYLMLGLILLGYILGLVLRSVLRRSYLKDSCIRLEEHPMVEALKERGWFVLGERGKAKPVFTKKRIAQGLGTASGEVWAQFREDFAAEAATCDKIDPDAE